MFRGVLVLVLGSVPVATGCDNIDIETGGGSITVNDECSATSADPLYSADPPGVVATCDDHQPCTWDVQCTPCEVVPEALRIKETCENYAELSPACFDTKTGELIYTGCTHFIYWTSPGVKNDCFPVKFPADPSSEPHAGVCSTYGICVENP